MFRILFFLVLFSLCFSCHYEDVKLRGEELCEQMQDVVIHHNNQKEKIDSLVRLSEGLSSAERYAVLFQAAQYTLRLPYVEEANHYLQQMDSLPFPEVDDKATGFMLLDCYDTMRFDFIDFAPRTVDSKSIASLLFDMENRWRLTPKEKLRFLVMKSGIYCNIFKEYKSARLIVKDGIRLARECGADQKMMMELYRVLVQSVTRLKEGSQLKEIGDDFANLVEVCQFDSLAVGTIYHTIGALYERQGDYHKAYDCLVRIKNVRSDRYYPIFSHVYAGIDSIPVALDYIEYWRKQNPHLVVLANMAWDEARIRQQMGDSAGYERCLQESVELFGRHSQVGTEVDGCAPSEAYARMLWQQGKRSEAIQRMELVSGKLISMTNLEGAETMYRGHSPKMNRMRLLRDYYSRVGRTEDALRQSLLCDSLEQQLTNARLRQQRQNTTTAMYTMDLMSNLDLRGIEFRQERQKFYFACFMLGVSLLLLGLVWTLYRQREKQLNVLYVRQKEIEQLQAEKQRMVPAERGKFSPEEQLFRDLERQFYQEELFRNPGCSRDDLCRLGGSNRMYVSTCINKYAGTNINQWINKARIDYAIRLIGEGEDDLTRLSEQSGFSSIKSFFRSFKQFTNLSPRQYIVRDRQREVICSEEETC